MKYRMDMKIQAQTFNLCDNNLELGYRRMSYEHGEQ